MNNQTSPWGKIVATAPLGELPLAITLSPDNRRVYLVTSLGKRLTVFDAATLKPIAGPIEIECKRGIAFLADAPPGKGRILIGGSVERGEMGAVTVFDATTLERVGEPIKVFGDNPVGIRVLPGVSPNKARVVVLHDGGHKPGKVRPSTLRR